MAHLGRFGAAADHVALSIAALESSYQYARGAVDIALARERLKMAQLCFNDVQHKLWEAGRAVGRMDLVESMCRACTRAAAAVRCAQADYGQLVHGAVAVAERGASVQKAGGSVAGRSEVEQEAQQLEDMRVALLQIIASSSGAASSNVHDAES